MNTRTSKLAVIRVIGVVLAIVLSFGCSTLGFLNPPGIGGYYVVDLTLEPDGRYIVVSPRELEGLYFGDVVVFNNKTGFVATVKFKNKTPFVAREFDVPKGGSPSAEDATVIVNPASTTEYEYTVTSEDGEIGIDQSPVIRVGPRPHTSPD